MHGSMIDMHCHFLPGVDDGPNDLETALEMARIAVADGIRFAVATPHIDPGRYSNDRFTIQARFDEFRRALREAGIRLRIGMASEVRLDLNVVAEGVEEVTQVEMLHRHRCDEVQGFLFAPPITGDEITELLASGTPTNSTLRRLGRPWPLRALGS